MQSIASSLIKPQRYYNLIFMVLAIFTGLETVSGLHFAWHRVDRLILPLILAASAYFLTRNNSLTTAEKIKLKHTKIQLYLSSNHPIYFLTCLAAATVILVHMKQYLLMSLIIAAIIMDKIIYPKLSAKSKSFKLAYSGIGIFMLPMKFPFS